MDTVNLRAHEPQPRESVRVRVLSAPPGLKLAKPSLEKMMAFATAAPPVTPRVVELGEPTLSNLSTPLVNAPSPVVSSNTSQPVDQSVPTVLQVAPFKDLHTVTEVFRFTASLRASMKSAANSLEVDTMLVLNMKGRIEGKAQAVITPKITREIVSSIKVKPLLFRLF